MWTLQQAVELIREHQTAAMGHGFYLALAGGVLNKGESSNDLDLVAVRRSTVSDLTELLTMFDLAGWQRLAEEECFNFYHVQWIKGDQVLEISVLGLPPKEVDIYSEVAAAAIAPLLKAAVMDVRKDTAWLTASRIRCTPSNPDYACEFHRETGRRWPDSFCPAHRKHLGLPEK